MYKYRTVQLSQNIQVEMKNHQGNEAAVYLGQIISQQAEQGWDFYRVDTIGVSVQPGCLDALLGKKAEQTNYYVATFRQKIDESVS